MFRQKNPIPKLTKCELLSRAFRIKPMVEDGDGTLHFIKPCDLESIAFTWNPVRIEEARGLTSLCEITTIHSYAAPVLFKPDLAEVLAQIPSDLLARVTAFTTVPHDDRQFTDGGEYHRAVTTLYTGELPASVKAYPVVYKKTAIYPSAEETAEPATKGIPIMKPLQFKNKGPSLP
jgi:hypothetical protein